MKFAINDFDDFDTAVQKTLDQVKKTAQLVTSGIANELTQEAKTAIETFYGHYNPVVYGPRHPDDKLDHGITRYYSNAHSVHYYGGVRLTPDKLKYDGYHSLLSVKVKVPKTYVFDLLMSGHHGAMENVPWSCAIPPVMTPSPYEIIKQKHSEIKSHLKQYIEKYGGV